MKNRTKATFFAILAAALYALNVPASKLLLLKVPPTMMAAFLYLGAGIGMCVWGVATGEHRKALSLTKKELPFTVGMIVLDIAAPILLMMGLQHTHAHTHAHAHDGVVHTHAHDHVHSHTHIHGQDEEAHSHSHPKLEDHDHSHA